MCIFDHMSLSSYENERYFRQKMERKSKHTFHFQQLFFFFFRKSFRVLDDGKIVVEVGRPQMKIWYMRITFSITKVTFTHSEYAVLIAFPLQQRLHECASMLRYTRIACLR
jgi:hypothetical protein